MTVDEVNGVASLAGLWTTSQVRRALVRHGCGALHETEDSTVKHERKANADFHQYLRSLITEERNDG